MLAPQPSRDSQNSSIPVGLPEPSELGIWIQLPDLSENPDPSARPAATCSASPFLLEDPSLTILSPVKQTTHEQPAHEQISREQVPSTGPLDTFSSELDPIETLSLETTASQETYYSADCYPEKRSTNEKPSAEGPLAFDRERTFEFRSQATTEESPAVEPFPEPSQPDSLESLDPQAIEVIPFPIHESARSPGLVQGVARIAPAMILLTLIGAATLLLLFLLGGSPSKPADHTTTDAPGNHSELHTSAASDKETNRPPLLSETKGLAKAKSIRDAAASQIDTTVQSAWPSGIPAFSGAPVVAELTGTIEPIDRMVDRQPTERQARVNTPKQSRK